MAGAQTPYMNENYMPTDLIGSARYVGMGGALGALGADISAGSSNPAALGLYRRSDAALSFSVLTQKEKPDLNADMTHLSFDQLGFVISIPIMGKAVRYVNFGANDQKRANFNNAFIADNGRLGGLSQTQQMADILNNTQYSTPLADLMYNACLVNPVSEYTRRTLRLETDYVYSLGMGMSLGAALNVNYTYVPQVLNPAYFDGGELSYVFAGLGLSVQYDTRDMILTPRRGMYVMVKEVFYPAVFSTYSRPVFSTTAVFDFYQPLWTGCVMGVDLYGKFNSRHAPWVLREELGAGGARMRGYYSGRYIDKNLLSAQLELRQHIWGRIGCAAWMGTGTVFPSFRELEWGQVLPTYGLGLRFEFKHNVNLRLDYGFGKGTSGIVLAFGEAF